MFTIVLLVSMFVSKVDLNSVAVVFVVVDDAFFFTHFHFLYIFFTSLIFIETIKCN